MTWTLEELAERAARALVDADVRVANGRVTGVPDGRLIRWYATIGLVDRPSIGPGRVARYSTRHLLQLVAVKRLQAQGLPLAEVQHRLAGATEASLRRIAALPPGLDEPGQDLPTPADRPARPRDLSERDDGPGADGFAVLRRPSRRQLRDMPDAATPGDGVSPRDAPVGDTTSTPFWAVRPGSPQSAHRLGGDQRVDMDSDTVTRVYGVRLNGLTLLLPAQPADDDLDAIVAAARPLLDLLAERGLLHRMADETPSGRSPRMTLRVVPMDEPEVTALNQPAPAGEREAGLGTLQTERGNLPLESVDAAVRITGLIGRIELTQGFHNPHDVALEATYVFPLPDRSAVTAMRLTADDRTVRAELRERGAAREQYDQAVAAGQRAAIAEEDRPDVFTMRVGNILPGERVSVALTLVGPLSYEDGEATFRLPLVVAPRYIPGIPTGSAVGDGYAHDTDAVPDASRITPPVLLPGFPNPVRLSIGVDIDPAGLPLGEVRSSLHTVNTEGSHLQHPARRAGEPGLHPATVLWGA